MYNWFYFICSNKEYHNLINFLLGEDTVSGITYLIFSDDIKCRDGRIFQRINEFLIAVSFYTSTTIFKDNMVKNNLKLGSLIDMYEIMSEDKNEKPILITKRAEYIVFDKDFESFLTNHNFIFGDGTVLTIPKASSSRRL